MKVSGMFSGRLGKAVEALRRLVPHPVRAAMSDCADEQGNAVPWRQRPLAPCNICGGKRFREWGGRGNRLSVSGRLPQCAQCLSLARHRVLRKVTRRLRKHLKQMRCLQISSDRSFRPTWFGERELSIHSSRNSLDIQRIARSDASYDVVVCNHVIEHVPDDRSAVRELGRILSDRGFLFISVPDPARHPQTIDWGRPNPMRHHHYREYGPDFADLLIQELPELSIVEAWAIDDSTGDPDMAYILTRNRAWFERVRRLPLRTQVHARRPLVD